MSLVSSIGPGEVRYIEPYALFIALPEGHARILRCMATTKREIRSGPAIEVRADANWNIEVLVPEDIKITTQCTADKHQSALVRLVFPEGQVIEKGQVVPAEYVVS